MDELVDGTLLGWPVSAKLLRNPGEPGCWTQVAPYTGEDDEPAPRDVTLACADCEGEFRTRRAAMDHLRRRGFKVGENE